MNKPTTPSLDEILGARKLLSSITAVTPVQESTALSEIAGVRVVLKCENLQKTGSFKLRGAFVRLSGLSEKERSKGVVAASAGNHAQGVAFAARRLGIPARVYMPQSVALPKLAATLDYGAEVLLVGDLLEALAAAQDDAFSTGRIFIPPFDHRDIIIGQATVGLEILEQVPDVRTIYVPTGGGGLLAGIASAMHSSDVAVDVIGVQAAGAAAFPESLVQNRPVPLTRINTMADGIAVGAPSELTLDLVTRHVTQILTVEEDAIARAILLLAERAKLVVEPSGAAGAAALLGKPKTIAGPVVVVLSGGNVDTLVFNNVLRHGLVAAGRYMQMEVRVPDRPGSLSAFLGTLASTESNVVNVNHGRVSADLGVSEVRIRVELETKGTKHCQQILAKLRTEGYSVTLE